MAAQFRTRDGRWSVEEVHLTHTASPSRWGDPAYGDGLYLLARTAGRFFYARSVAELEESGLFRLDDLEVVTS